jgi:Ca2+-binding RTX toxin-like protein
MASRPLYLHDLPSEQLATPDHISLAAADSPFADLFEQFAERSEDADRDGYNNFGSGSDFGTYFRPSPDGYYTDASDAFFNGQGGDDNLRLIGNGNNTMHGGSGNDTLTGGTGNDTIYGDSGNDTLNGYDGNDKLYGGSGNDTLDGGTGNDMLDGGSGNDLLKAGMGNDTLYGGTGNDVLKGDYGDDLLDGGAGNDVLVGGAGKDILTGGSGADTFVFSSFGDSTADHPDIITDFQRGQDKIDLSMVHGFITISSQADGQHVEVQNPGGQNFELIVHTTDGLQLTASDFHL